MTFRIPVLVVLLAAAMAVSLSAQTFYTSPAVSADEKAQAAEARPNFASPQVEDPSLKVPGLPEPLKWYTSRPGVWGSARAKQGGTYRGYLGEFPMTFRTLGPEGNGGTRPLFGNTPSLVEVNAETKDFIPALATHWAFAADGKTVFYKLNEKARWSDGKPVTSKDYVFMLAFMRDKNIQDEWYNDFFTTQITDLKAYGDWVVSVTWNAALAPQDLLLNTSVQPRPAHFYPNGVPADYPESYNWKAEPTAGAYYLADSVKDESLTFKKVKDWWGYTYTYNKYRFNVDTIEYKVITGGNDIVRNYFFNGDLDTFAQIIPTEWANGEKAEKYTQGYVDRQWAYYVPLTGLSGIIFNTKDPVFSDVNVRRGLYSALNMRKMIDTALRGEYALYHNIGIAHVFAGINFDDDSIRKPKFDPAAAGALFDKAGFSTVGSDGIRQNAKGLKLSFELLYSSPNHTERLSVLREEAKKAGVDLKLQLQQKGLFGALLEKKYQAAWLTMSTSLTPDYYEYFHSSYADDPQTNNFFGYKNPEMDKLVEAYRAESSLAKKAEIDRKIQKLVDQEALVMPNYYVPFVRGASWKWLRFPRWLDTQFDGEFYDPMGAGLGSYMGYFWIDPAIKKEVQQAMKDKKAYEPRTVIDTTYKAK